MTSSLLALSAHALALGSPAPAVDAACCQVVELRQYITYPGKRDVLIKLFEREFIESQEAVGIEVLGLFRDHNDPHRYTWLRGFPSMPARQQALTEFYGGSVWKRWRDEANATLYDNDDVLLLRPARANSGFNVDASTRAPQTASLPQKGLVVATIYYFKQEVSGDFIAHFNGALAPVFQRNGASMLGLFVSEKSPNTFARLPVRENVNAFVWFAHFADRAAWQRYNENLGQDVQWRDALFAPLYKSLLRTPETLLLEPAARSLLR
ncbi:MAG: NIPSNAP family protein [Massilia sp.]